VLALDINEAGTRLFGAVGGAGNHVVSWNTTTGLRNWRQWADGDVQAVVHHRDTVHFGFHESFEGDTRLRLLAADATTGALDPDFRQPGTVSWVSRRCRRAMTCSPRPETSPGSAVWPRAAGCCSRPISRRRRSPDVPRFQRDVAVLRR
jgi:hypothetical protein